MGLSIYNIKKWAKMFAGKSVLHVNQGMGRVFVAGKLEGYFNDLTQKVLMQPQYIDSDELPTVKTENGDDILFPVAIFQYGLGCWDLFLLTHEEKYKDKFLLCARWALEQQEKSGAWNNFFFIYPEAPYGAMAQGEAASLLLRAYRLLGETKYFDAAKSAIDYMLTPLERGGTAQYVEDDLVLCEYTNHAAVLNGWIFSLYGLYDFCLVCAEEQYRSALRRTIDTLKRLLPKFDNNYWSMYDLEGRIASPFYHNLHIAQLEALSKTTSEDFFKEYSIRFKGYGGNPINYAKAVLRKGLQKIRD